jgi:hypothetical protein
MPTIIFSWDPVRFRVSHYLEASTTALTDPVILQQERRRFSTDMALMDTIISVQIVKWIFSQH